jgi:hypothetical protein
MVSVAALNFKWQQQNGNPVLRKPIIHQNHLVSSCSYVLEPYGPATSKYDFYLNLASTVLECDVSYGIS